MDNFSKGNDLIVRWAFLYEDGSAFPLTNYAYQLCYVSGRGVSVVNDTAAITVSGNILTWRFSGKDQKVNGKYSLILKLYLNGKLVATYNKREAFQLIDGKDAVIGTVELSSFCDSLSLQEIYSRERERLREAAETTRKSNETARQTAETTRMTNESARVTAETQRATDFTTAQTTRQSTFEASETSRANTFSASESSRANTFTTSESSRATTFSTNEAARQATFDSKESARDSATAIITQEATKLTNLESKVGTTSTQETTVDMSVGTWTNGRSINTTSGNDSSSSSSSCTAYCAIPTGTSRKLIYTRCNTTSTSTTVGLCFYNSSKTFITGKSQGYKTGQSVKGIAEAQLDIPDNACYIRFTCWTDQTVDFYAKVKTEALVYTDGLGKDVADNTSDIATIKNNIGEATSESQSKNLNVSDWISKKSILISSGASTTSTSSSATDFIRLPKFKSRTLSYKRCVTTSASSTVGLAVYDKDETFISGGSQSYQTNGSAYGITDGTFSIPDSAYYIRFTCLTDYLEEFSASVSYVEKNYDKGLGLEVEELTESFADLANEVDELEKRVDAVVDADGEWTNDQCLDRFGLALNEKLTSYGITGFTSYGPGGYGAKSWMNMSSAQMGQSFVPIYGVVKYITASLGYNDLAKVWSEDNHIIYTKKTNRKIQMARSWDSHYGSVITDAGYTILGWKTGSKGAITNLAVIATCKELKGKVLVAVMNRILQADTEESNRSIATKYLLDIGKAKCLNRNADVSAIETQMLSYCDPTTSCAMVIELPVANGNFLHHWDICADDYFRLYHYPTLNRSDSTKQGFTSVINTMSMIKVLVCEIVLDYIADIDQFVTIKDYDISAATGGTGAIFRAGDRVSYRDLIYAALLPSSNQACYVMAREVGKHLLNKYGTDGFFPSTNQ